MDLGERWNHIYF